MSRTATKHAWAFAPRFRRGAFGWSSEPAITRIKEAVAEIRAAAKKDALLGAEGAVLFLQKLSPALQNIDGSSGAVGAAANRAIEALAAVIAKAPADAATRRRWLDTLFQAHAEDDVPYIEALGDYWGDLCASPELAVEWADLLCPPLESNWSHPRHERGHFHAEAMCLSAMLAAGRHEELLTLLEKCPYAWWHSRRWGVKALLAMGRKQEALRYAEASRGLNAPDAAISAACESILLSSGLAEEAYRRYAIAANQGTTYLSTFRAICRKYPHKAPEDLLKDLVASTPGSEGKWFAAARDAKLLALALDLARRSSVDHRTLIRAARDTAASEPEFAAECALLALHWIAAGRGYEVTALDVLDAFDYLAQASAAAGGPAAAERVAAMLAAFPQERFVRKVLGEFRRLALPA